jgi:hypothetical protein
LFFSFLLLGCGTQLALSGKAREDYLKSIRPYGTYWVKDGMTAEQRRRDSWACGAAPTAHAADHVAFSAEQLRRERHADEHDNFGSRERLTKEWVACMKSKGYRYND